MKKVSIIASGQGGVLVITDFEEIEMGEGSCTSSSIQEKRNHTQIETAATLQQIQFLKQQNITLESELHVMKRSLTDMVGKLHKAVSRMASSPLMYSTEREGHGTLNTLTRSLTDSRATLSASPKSLHTLWLEYQHGIGGRKPAKMFTPGERGRVKHKYCIQKPFWELISRMIQN